MSRNLQRLLYQFPLSHYCEKTRWHMDHKGLDYRIVNLFPGFHRRRTQRLGGIDTLPLLRDQGRWVGDSTTIALYLEENYPERSLIPAEAGARAQVLALEAEFDDIGDDVRRWVFGDIVHSPDLGSLMFNEYPLPVRLLGKAMTPLMRVGLGQLYKLSPRRVAASLIKLDGGLDRIEALLQDNVQGYLVGGELSLADITAASLYGPLLGPKNSPWGSDTGLQPLLAEKRRAVRERPAGQWLMRLYAEERGRSGWLPARAG